MKNYKKKYSYYSNYYNPYSYYKNTSHKRRSYYDKKESTIEFPSKSNYDRINLILVKRNIEFILSSFRYSNKIEDLDQEFRNNSSVFSPKSELPDIYVKTTCPINKNRCFYDLDPDKKNRKFDINFFPSTPFIISPNSDLIEDDSATFNYNSSSNIPFTKNEDIPLVQVHFDNDKMDSCFNGYLHKTWFISYMINNYQWKHGPFNSLRIYNFLKYTYSNRSKTTQDNTQKIMIIDEAFDVHYQPENLLEILEEEQNKAKSIFQKINDENNMKNSIIQRQFENQVSFKKIVDSIIEESKNPEEGDDKLKGKGDLLKGLVKVKTEEEHDDIINI